MTDLRQAAQMAIEALDCVCNEERTCDVLHHGRAEYHAIGENCPAVKRLWVARRTLSEALAAPQPQPVASNIEPVSNDAGQAPKMDAQPEPVAFYDFGNHRMRWAKPTKYTAALSVDLPLLPLYAAPPRREWVGLTGGDISIIYGATWDRPLDDWQGSVMGDFARAIEAKLKERNHE
jgi:hypothetical protein